MGKKVRIGIDVGGTFTDAVALDNETYDIIAKKKIPTTHKQGVAKGIIIIINEILEENQIDPNDVVFIAHGTTQATNALLEGDVAKVGVIGMGSGMDSRSAKRETNIESIELAPGKFLHTENTFIDSDKLTESGVSDSIQQLVKSGAEVIVASEAYSVDNPENELKVIEQAKKQKVFATGGHEISQLYGLKMRTRTAVVNASLIPKMIQTADMTESAVKDTHINSNLMIMRADGGVMDVSEVRKRPILTMLSGLAAGVAGALMYEKISDGIFFEAGGTSIDISVIKNGKVMIKYAQVGGHKTYLRSLDVRTFGIAGGSMIRVKDKKIIDVGPRSAHIANLDYECFTTDKLEDLTLDFIAPRSEDPKEYAIVCGKADNYSLTLAGAANILGEIPDDDYAKGNEENSTIAWQALGDYLGVSAKEAAQQAVNVALDKLQDVVNQLIKEYDLEPSLISLVGGGGSAGVITPLLGERLHYQWKIAKNAPYISTIGVALAMVREQIERSITNPTDTDIKKIRSDVIEQVVKSGANEATVEVNIEIDTQKNIVRAIATGSTELRKKNMVNKKLTDDDLKQIASKSISLPESDVQVKYSTGRWHLVEGSKVVGRFIFKKHLSLVCVLDRDGVVRFKNNNAHSIAFHKGETEAVFDPFVETHTVYSDANATIPKVFAFYREKMLDLTGMQNFEQLKSILDVELEGLDDEDEIIAIAYQ